MANQNTSYNHSCRFSPGFGGDYLIAWTVDSYSRTSVLRSPRRMSRKTNEAGAKKFCHKHGVKLPVAQ